MTNIIGFIVFSAAAIANGIIGADGQAGRGRRRGAAGLYALDPKPMSYNSYAGASVLDQRIRGIVQ